jgi:hypothetical protein
VKDNLRRLLYIAAVALAAGLAVYAYQNGAVGNDATSESKPTSVERLIPASGSNVLRQDEVGIDLAVGYDATLTINGTTISNLLDQDHTDGLQKNLAIGLITYAPGPGKRVEKLASGRNCVIANVWKPSEGESSAKPVEWCFNAT